MAANNESIPFKKTLETKKIENDMQAYGYLK